LTIKCSLAPRGHPPGWFRPCPFDWPKSLMGIRDIKIFSTPSLITPLVATVRPHCQSHTCRPASPPPSRGLSGRPSRSGTSAALPARSSSVNVCPSSSSAVGGLPICVHHLMEKNRSRGASIPRSIIRLRHGRLGAAASSPRHFSDLAGQLRFARQTARRGGRNVLPQTSPCRPRRRLRFHDKASRSAG